MNKARKLGIPTPALYLIDIEGRKFYMEYLGPRCMQVNEFLKGIDIQVEENLVHIDEISSKIGNYLGKLHSSDIIHGDLTTSNLILKPKGNLKEELKSKKDALTIEDAKKEEKDLFIIDYGLSFISSKAEDKAVDIYVLQRAFVSTHPGSEFIFQKILAAYKEANKKS